MSVLAPSSSLSSSPISSLVFLSSTNLHRRKANSSTTHFAFKQRNFDPETRQARKRGVGEGGEDTVEKAVEGLAEEIVQEDEERRAEDLVSGVNERLEKGKEGRRRR